MTGDFKKLEDCRDALLLAEMAAWIHMFGKFHEDFLKGKHELDIQIPQDVNDYYPNFLNSLEQTWTGQIWQKLGIEDGLDACQLSFKNLIEKHTKNASYKLEKLMQDAHGRGSGVEKGLLVRFTSEQQDNVYISTAFGFESGPIDLNEIENVRKKLYKFLQMELKKLEQTNAQPPESWRSFRQTFIPTITKMISLTVGDTRRPLNDVTLFDQTIASVAFFKAVLAQILLEGWKDPNQNKKVADRYHWRILRIGFNGPIFWSKSLKISDISARKQLIEPLLDEIQHLIETDYPMGYEIYRDEMGSAFIVPDVDDLIDTVVDRGQTLTKTISDLSRKHFDLETNVHLFPITPKTRNMLPFGQRLSEIVPEPSIDNTWLKDIQTLWSQSNEVCSVCNLRPQGPNEKALLRNVCDICELRRTDRAKIWSARLNHTLWIDEVADINGRIALITGVFDIGDWLKGIMLSTIVVFDPKTHLLKDPERENKEYVFDYSQLRQDIRKRVQNPNQTLGGKTLVDNLILKNSRGGHVQFGDIYDLYVSDSDLNHIEREDWRFALAMIRQQPSPARIRRVWETTRNFWQDILPTKEETEISKSESGRVLGLRELRLAISGYLISGQKKSTPGPYHAYQLRLKNTNLSVVWDSKNQRFITADNLDAISEPTRLGENVKIWLEAHIGKNIIIEEPTGYGSQNKTWGSINIKKVEQIPDSEYTPAIPILAEPRTFMALVPADKALDLVTKINEKYEREMGKVRNRLPLHTGIVFASHKTPLRTILDAGRRMMVEKTASVDGWEVVEKKHTEDGLTLPKYLSDNNLHFTECVRLKLTRENRTAVWHVPLTMGDGETHDCWYPYVFVQHYNDGNAPSGRKRMFEAPCPWNLDSENNPQPTWLVHAKDIENGDVIYFTPSTLDFQWLDTSGRRFEIDYDNEGRRRDMPQRPYMLGDLDTLKNEIWGTLKKHLSSSQIHALYELIETKRYEWEVSDSEVFRKFCCDAIVNLEWKRCKIDDSKESVYPWKTSTKSPEEDWLKKWTDYAVYGWLSDVIELYMKVLKEKPEKNLEETV